MRIEFDAVIHQIPQPGGHAAALVTKYRGHSPSASEWAVFVEKQGVWELCGNGTKCITSPMGSVTPGVKYHVLAVLDGSRGSLWIDNQLVASGEVARNPRKTTTPVIVGDSFQPGHSNRLIGQVTNVVITPPN